MKEMILKAVELDNEREAILWLSVISCLGAGYLIYFLMKKLFQTLDDTTATNKKLVEMVHYRVDSVEKLAKESNEKLDKLLGRG